MHTSLSNGNITLYTFADSTVDLIQLHLVFYPSICLSICYFSAFSATLTQPLEKGFQICSNCLGPVVKMRDNNKDSK